MFLSISFTNLNIDIFTLCKQSNKVNDFRTELGRKEDERSSELKDDDTNERGTFSFGTYPFK